MCFCRRFSWEGGAGLGSEALGTERAPQSRPTASGTSRNVPLPGPCSLALGTHVLGPTLSASGRNWDWRPVPLKGRAFPWLPRLSPDSRRVVFPSLFLDGRHRPQGESLLRG